MSMPMTSSSALSARSPRSSEPAAARTCRYLNFAQFQVDLQREELFKDGTRVHVPAKVYQVLLALLEKPGDIVTREELRARLWPGGTFVNFDANVNTTVNKLRFTLGDSPETPVFVETIPRQGYCFVGKVEHRNEPAKVPQAGASKTASPAPASVNGGETPETANAPPAIGAISKLFPTFLRSGWAAAVLLCGVLIGMGIVMLMHRAL